ncbi:HigA family addiction module antitoxin [Gordonia neofelifaecis]|uniref:Plasmid maintenance system antidote protein, XRE family n=1 Tax=Gordonia neofelifaecis NRRL B-59395 TaxID=644548 RepID=F1YEH8_9ACTN|nr:plasmid maintenance system antidote protein, XRE family [Gordonia neofelifaecis NRRL B-59395]
MTTTDKIAPIHPGEILMEDFIEGFGITQNKLTVSIGVPPRRINEIVHGKRGITADTALRLAKYFGTSAEFWLNLQSHYDLDRAADRAGEQIASITPCRSRDRQSGSLRIRCGPHRRRSPSPASVCVRCGVAVGTRS